ncbi:flagellin lysine-N-methylase [Niameybacter massiliensis]|uniref:Flagellin lysine-N-methylase n=1 Tax=Holtiella tumoricola TaxID=3018743 RepID=A0AA42DLA4_9FIRM|nr:flagellin lysine-N-methylase [Holtiella tumoricola]MDA3731084.1 flagellin lysine-N-methylase [Holtiella tumoricola]
MSHTIKVNDYETFRCIADKCSFSCCQEWRIAVDDKTAKNWEGLRLNQTQLEGETLPELSLCNCLEKEEDGQIITLNKEKKCPFLNTQKLCRLVIELGEETLSKTCTTFPRQINQFEDRIEYSLSTACPVVIDLLNENPVQFYHEEEGKSSLLYVVREMMFTLMQDEHYTLTERIMMIFYALLELLEDPKLTVDKINLYTDAKQMKPLITAIRKMKFNLMDSFWERNELFLDVVDNYRKQKLYVAFLEDIATKAEQLETLYSNKELIKKIEIFNQEIKAYERLLTNYLLTEIFANGLMAEMELEDMVVAFEWVTLEYATIKQAIFLKWLTDGKEKLEYYTVRDYMMIVARVTGYDQSDIREYLENSFESAIWDWGYLALVVGNSVL